MNGFRWRIDTRMPLRALFPLFCVLFYYCSRTWRVWGGVHVTNLSASHARICLKDALNPSFCVVWRCWWRSTTARQCWSWMRSYIPLRSFFLFVWFILFFIIIITLLFHVFEYFGAHKNLQSQPKLLEGTLKRVCSGTAEPFKGHCHRSRNSSLQFFLVPPLAALCVCVCVGVCGLFFCSIFVSTFFIFFRKPKRGESKWWEGRGKKK